MKLSRFGHVRTGNGTQLEVGLLDDRARVGRDRSAVRHDLVQARAEARQPDRERRTVAVLARDLERAAVSLDDRPHDREAEPEPAVAATVHTVVPREALEDALLVFCSDAGARVGDLDHRELAFGPAGDRDPVAVVRRPQGVLDQLVERKRQLVLVAWNRPLGEDTAAPCPGGGYGPSRGEAPEETAEVDGELRGEGL